MVSYLPEFPCPPTSTSHHSLVRVVSSTLKKTADNILDGRLSHSFIFPTVLGFTSLPKSHENLSFVYEVEPLLEYFPNQVYLPNGTLEEIAAIGKRHIYI